MLRSMRSVVLVLFSCAGVIGFVAGAQADPEALLAPSAGPISGSLVIPELNVLVAGEQQKAEEAIRLSDPQSRAITEASLTAYSRMGDSSVATLTQEVLPGVVERTADTLSLPADERISRYLSRHTALVELSSGKHAVVESVAPIATGPGDEAALNLNLARTSSGFTPRDPATPVDIPTSLSDGIELSASKVSLTPLDASGSPLVSDGRLDGQAVLFPNSQIDSDVLVKPTSTGFESFTMLRSKDSPSQLSFRLSVPAGARLVSGHGGGRIEVVEDGHPLAGVPAPMARDATGMSVPVSTSLAGNVLSLSVKYRDGKYRYPIVVDPTVEDTAMLLKMGSLAGNWVYGGSSTFTSGGCSCMFIEAAGEYTPGQSGYVEYRTQHQSRIYGVVGNVTEEQYSFEPTLSTSLSLRRNNGEIEKIESFPPKTAATYYPGVKVCGEAGCAVAPVNSLHEENSVIFKVEALKSGSFGESRLESAGVQINQEKGPSVSVDTTDSVFGASPNGAYPGRWASGNTAEIGLIANDPGIGISADSFSSPQEVSWGHGFSAVPGCEGVQCDECWNYEVKCEAGHSSGKEPLPYSLKGLPDGKDTIEAKVEDATTLAASTSITVSMDSTAPHNVTLIGLPASHEIGESNYRLRATASDGSSIESSGIESIAFQMDGVAIGASSGSCSPGPCTATSKEVSINGEEFGAGQHTLSVVATDKAGNVASENITVTVHHASPVAAGPGLVEPVTGEMSLSSNDVSVAAGSTNLTLSRTYLSRHLTAGSSGPLGPQWGMSVGGEESLIKQPNGSMLLIGPSGGQTIFTSAGSGKFNPPAGDAGLVLTEKTVSGKTIYLLVNGGSTTTFAIPAGGAGGVWVPSISEGAGGTNVTTFAFKTVGGITEPEKVLGPVPSGVSCSPTLNKGCRELTFTYATSTTASSEAPSGWGDYNGRLTKVSFTGWDPASSKMTTTSIVQYSYDTQGRLRAEWDPRVSPALKTTYGYDVSGHVTAVSSPGQEPWLLAYGSNAGDTNTGRFVSASRPPAAAALGESAAPSNTATPALSTLSPVLGKSVSVTNGTWSNSPLSYAYQWERCGLLESNCSLIYGARNQSYLPTVADAGYELVARVTAFNADGATTVSSTSSSLVAGLTPTSTIQFGSVGTGGGQFKQPTSAAFDASGNLWVTDEANNRVEEFSPSGEYLKSVGSTGTENGQFKGAWGVAIEQSTGNLFITDQGLCRVEEMSPSGTFIRAFGGCGSGAGQLSAPSGVALDPEGNVWVADFSNNRLEEFSSTGTFMRTVASTGTGNGQLKNPRGIVFVSGNLYVTDMGNNRVQEFSAEGAYLTQFGASGTGNGQFSSPMGIAYEPLSGDLVVADDNNNRVQQFTATGTFVAKFGTVGTGAGQLKTPTGVAVSATGTIMAMDSGNNRVSQWWPTPSPNYGMAIGSLGSGNGQFNKPIADAVDPTGNLWVTDSSNNRIEKFSQFGAYLGAYGSLGTSLGQFDGPAGIAVNPSTGNVYVSDQKNGRVEEFSPSGKYIAEFGKGQIIHPYGVAIDPSGNIWVADLASTTSRVDEYSQSGTTFTLLREIGKKGAGNGEFARSHVHRVLGRERLRHRFGQQSRPGVRRQTGKFIAKFGTKGVGNGQFEGPEGTAALFRYGALGCSCRAQLGGGVQYDGVVF